MRMSFASKFMAKNQLDFDTAAAKDVVRIPPFAIHRLQKISDSDLSL
jgi:hypothetical protein